MLQEVISHLLKVRYFETSSHSFIILDTDLGLQLFGGGASRGAGKAPCAQAAHAQNHCGSRGRDRLSQLTFAVIGNRVSRREPGPGLTFALCLFLRLRVSDPGSGVHGAGSQCGGEADVHQSRHLPAGGVSPPVRADGRPRSGQCGAAPFVSRD